MARLVDNIFASLQASLVVTAQSVGLVIVPTNWSRTDYKGLALYVIAVAQAVFEQLYDAFVVDVEAIALRLPPQTPLWFQYQMINVFEYDATAVPIVVLDESTDFVPQYPNPNDNYKIVDYCSVVNGIFGSVAVKIAGSGPSQITGSALAAAQEYINTVASPGINYAVTSGISDKLFMQLDVYYNGLYAAIIKNSVTDAINGYLQSIPFNGILVLSKIESAILAVPGVTDMVFVNVQTRQNSTTVMLGTNLVLNNLVLLRNWQTQAGYIILENTSGYTLSDARALTPSLLNLNLVSN